MQLFDTHTHFDVAEFDADRLALAQTAWLHGVRGLVLIGFEARRFEIMSQVADQLNQQHRLHQDVPRCYLAPGLHPFYIEMHRESHLDVLDKFLMSHRCIALGEIGLDRFEVRHKPAIVQAQQAHFFSRQLDLARHHQLPVMLHIRKAHGETLALLRQHRFTLGGIAHAFSGGVEEARAFVRLGFKIGITGQISNPNAKRLRQVVAALSPADLVLETDCPDMTPLCCQQSHEQRTRNTPGNLVYVLESLANVLACPADALAALLWRNTCQILDLNRWPD